MLRRLQPLLWIGAIAGALWLIFPFGFPNYDTVYPLVWGGELAHGVSPDYGAPQPPTPHPLADLWGVIATPLGAAGASIATTVIAYLAVAAIGYLVYRLGALWFDRAIGAVAAFLVLTRPELLSDGLRAYIDLPYIALVLWALVIETRRPRAGGSVLALLAVAGLLRPEAWLFSAAYLFYLVLELERGGGRFGVRRREGITGRELGGWIALAASAPLLWGAFDLVTTGDPLYSFTVTHQTVGTLERKTGPIELLRYGPKALAQALQWTGVVAAAAGLVLGLALMRRRSLVGFCAAVLSGAAFAVLASSGLAIIPRYTLLAAAVLCVFCAVALLGWRLLAGDNPWRRRWQLIAVAVFAILLIQGTQQYHFLSTVRNDLKSQSAIESDLHHLADSGAFRPGCRPIAVPNHRGIPRLAAWLDQRPSSILSVTEQHPPSHGYFLEPATPAVERHFATAKVPPHFHRVARNESFVLYAHCG